MSEAKAKTDWEAIEANYRAGILSLREIGRAQGVSDTAIRKRAKAEGWERDLTAQVKVRARVKLVRTDGSQGQRTRTDAEIIEEASDTQVSVVRSHRRDISTGRRIIASLFDELIEGTERREEIDAAIEVETAGDTNGQRAAMMRRAVALPSRAATMQSLAGALKHIVVLERQAFSIDTGGDPDEPATKGDVSAALAKLDRGQRDQLRGIVSSLAGGSESDVART